MNPHYFTVPYLGIANSIPSPVIITNSKLYPKREYTALWDTGSTESAISERVVKELMLQPVGEKEVYSVGHKDSSKIFLVNIGLPCGVMFPNMRVTSQNFDGYDVLIGMDIISQGDFAITHKDQKTKFSFQYPSTHDIDFSET